MFYITDFFREIAKYVPVTVPCGFTKAAFNLAICSGVDGLMPLSLSTIPTFLFTWKKNVYFLKIKIIIIIKISKDCNFYLPLREQHRKGCRLLELLWHLHVIALQTHPEK